MNKKIKILIVVMAVVIVVGLAAIPVLKWYNNQEHIIVSKGFDVTINKNSDLIYFDEDDNYLHAAYGVSEEEFENIVKEMLDNNYYQESEVVTEIDGTTVLSPIVSNNEWIPQDKITKAYCQKTPSKENKGYDFAYVYVTDSKNGFVEMYFIK